MQPTARRASSSLSAYSVWRFVPAGNEVARTPGPRSANLCFRGQASLGDVRHATR